MLAFEEKSLGINHVRSGGSKFGLFYGVRKIGFEKRTMENYIIFACLCLEVSLGFFKKLVRNIRGWGNSSSSSFQAFEENRLFGAV